MRLLCIRFVAVAVALTGCGGVDLCAGMYGLAIFDPPAGVDRYHAVVSFEDQEFEIDCVADPLSNVSCWAPRSGDWDVTFYLDLYDADLRINPMSIGIVNHGEPRVPDGEIVIRLTSPDLPGKYVEHRSIAHPRDYEGCEEASDIWYLPTAWDDDS